MKSCYQRQLIDLLGIALICLPACAPCREVRIESEPPGAVVYLRSSEFSISPPDFPEEEWKRLGVAPLFVDSCRLTDELKASWEGHDLFLFDYSGSGYIRFDFEEGRVKPLKPLP